MVPLTARSDGLSEACLVRTISERVLSALYCTFGCVHASFGVNETDFEGVRGVLFGVE